MLDLGLSIICGLLLVATAFQGEPITEVRQDTDPLHILDHFEILVFPFLEHPERDHLKSNSTIPRERALVVDVNCDIRGDFVVFLKNHDGAQAHKRFYSRPGGGEPDTISFILERPPDGQLHIGIERDGEIAYATFDGL